MEFRAHPFTIRQLQYVVAVAEQRSFRAAAELCHVSQPSLSAQIAEVESVLRVRLFDRDRRGVLLTPAGEVVVARAREALRACEDVRVAASALVDPLKGRLRVGVIPTLAPYLLPCIDPALRAAFPDLELIWREDKTEGIVRALTNAELDAGLVALEADLGDVESAVVGIDRFLCATPPGHRFTRSQRPLRIEDLNGENVLLLEDGHCFRDQALALCNAAGTRELGFRATSLATLAQMVAGGVGITLLPESAMTVEGRDKGLVFRGFKAPQPKRTVAFVWRRGNALSKALRKVGDTARRAYGARWKIFDEGKG